MKFGLRNCVRRWHFGLNYSAMGLHRTQHIGPSMQLDNLQREKARRTTARMQRILDVFYVRMQQRSDSHSSHHCMWKCTALRRTTCWNRGQPPRCGSHLATVSILRKTKAAKRFSETKPLLWARMDAWEAGRFVAQSKMWRNVEWRMDGD